jgi:hypothetical protein
MKHEELRAEPERLLHLGAEGVDRALPDAFSLRAEVDQEARVDDHRIHVMLRAKLRQLVRVGPFHRAGLPRSRAGAEDLKRVCACVDGAIHRRPHTA